jgi:excisionase family DNA binding protein
MPAPHTPERTIWPAAMKMETAAQYLDVDKTYVEQMLRDNLISAIQLRDGGDRRIRKEELDRYLEYRASQPVKVKRSA